MKLKHTVVAIVLAAGCLAILKPARGQSPSAMPQLQAPLTVPLQAPLTVPQIQTIPAGPFYVSIKGQVQGQFKMEIPATPQHAGTIAGIRFSFSLTSPRDPATGLAVGKRQFSVTFTKMWGPSSPQILQACSTNENLTAVTFEFSHQKMILTNATISSVQRYIGVPIGNEPPDPRELEDVSLTFQKIQLVDATNTTYNDSWLAAP